MPGCSHQAAKDSGGWPELLGLQMRAWARALHGGGDGDDGGGEGSDGSVASDDGGTGGGGMTAVRAAAKARVYGVFLERSQSGFNPWSASLRLEGHLNAQYLASTREPLLAAEGVPTAIMQRGKDQAAGIGRLAACVMHAMLWPRAELRRSLAPLLSRLGDTTVVALQLRTGWAEAAASFQSALGPVVRGLINAPLPASSSLGNDVSPPPPPLWRGKGKGKGKAQGPRVPLEYAAIAEALVATPNAMLLQLRSKVAGVEALEIEMMRRGLSLPPGVPRTFAAAKQFLLPRERLACPNGRCLFRKPPGNTTELTTGNPRKRQTAFYSPDEAEYLRMARQVMHNTEALNGLPRRHTPRPHRFNTSVPRSLLLARGGHATSNPTPPHLNPTSTQLNPQTIATGEEAVELRWRAMTNNGQRWHQCGTMGQRNAPDASVQARCFRPSPEYARRAAAARREGRISEAELAALRNAWETAAAKAVPRTASNSTHARVMSSTQDARPIPPLPLPPRLPILLASHPARFRWKCRARRAARWRRLFSAQHAWRRLLLLRHHCCLRCWRAVARRAAVSRAAARVAVAQRQAARRRAVRRPVARR